MVSPARKQLKEDGSVAWDGDHVAEELRVNETHFEPVKTC